MSADSHGRRASTTVPSDEGGALARSKPIPGLLLVFADRKPMARVFRSDAAPLELGRSDLANGELLDGMISRKHARLTFADGEWLVEDLASLNGTFVNGRRITAEAPSPLPSAGIVRIGGALLLSVADVVPFEHYGLGSGEGLVQGPALRRALETVAQTQKALPSTLLVEGESGTGKELVARAFHAAGRGAAAPFVSVSCATLPKDLAERLVFGSRRGGGSTDAPGYVQSAQGGTLFFDEIAALSLEMQSQLLRLLETREVLPGATGAELADVRVCAASAKELRDEVGAGRFREDLYFRIGKPEVRLPPLRERLEEVPWHIQHVLEEFATQGEAIVASASFVDACMRRLWPGNARELRAEVRRAAGAAIAEGSRRLASDDLSPVAGNAIVAPKLKEPARFPEDDVARALALESGNVLGAARRLGVHRNKVRRWLERHHVDAEAFKRRTSL
jgi:pSer/pThr/pTyr-binding forkhead associated (FHA) protein